MPRPAKTSIAYHHPSCCINIRNISQLRAILAVMSMTSAEEIYSSLFKIFADRKSDEVLEIEILTPGSGPLLRDELCIGVTKAALVKAFLVARQKLTKYLIQRNERTGHGTTSLEKADDVNELAITTQIILLFDCEHVTACNWRKQFISFTIQKHSIEHDYRLWEDLLQRERTLMTSFQCSPLHRHTKSPTLWQHRLWIMTKLLTLKEQNGAQCEISKDFLSKLILEELDMVCKSGQLHPRNYYAFSYMRQLHALLCQYHSPKEGTLPEEASRNNRSTLLLLDLTIAMIEPMLKWCLSSPSDISGWMYLYYLLDCDSQKMNTPSILENRMVKERILVMERTICFAVYIATWEGESLWTFVDLMIARFGIDVLPKVDATKTELWNSSPASGARWKTTKVRVHVLYKGNS